MRILLVCLLSLIMALPAGAAPSQGQEQGSSIFQWIETYNKSPKPNAVPKIVKDMSRLGAFRDPEAAGFYVGFVAGVLAANPKNAKRLTLEMLPLSAEDDWVVVRAVAWSGVPSRDGILAALRDKLPNRQALIDRYAAGELPDLFETTVVPPAPKRGLKALFKKKEKEARLPTADNLDALWGFYLATGSTEPLDRIIAFLPLSEDADNVDRLAIGGMAKYMLASAAVRKPSLLAALKDAQPRVDEKTGKALADVIDAAEEVDAGRIRSEQTVALEELKREGPGSRKKMTKWGRIGEGAISLGCVAAAAAGQVYLGIPCVVGGAATSAALRYWSTRQ